MNRVSVYRRATPVVVVTVLLSLLLIVLLSRTENKLQSVRADLQEGNAFVLSPEMDTNAVADLLLRYNYVENKKDAVFVAQSLRERTEETVIPSLFALQKRDIGQVSAKTVDSCGVLTKAYQKSCEVLEQSRLDSVFEYHAPSGTTGAGRFKVVVEEKVSEKSRKTVPCPNVQVMLLKHVRDSLNQPDTVLLGFVKTDAKGVAVIEGLDRKASYSVLPVKKGYEYGQSKGTYDGQWGNGNKSDELTFTFTQQEHKIQLLDNATVRRIKRGHTLMVRSPDAFKSTLTWCFVAVMLAWWLLCLVIIIRKKELNGLLVAACMFLTGLCVLMMFSMQDPVNDALIGVDMTKGVIIGVVVAIVFQWVDFVKFYQNNCAVGFDVLTEAFRWLFKPFKEKVARLAAILKSDCNVLKKVFALLLVVVTLPFILLDWLQITRLHERVDRFCAKLPKGIGWLVMALLLTALLWTPFGRSVGGMRVNLNLFGLVFQPSEIAKYLIMLFVAAFFTRNADAIIAYSQPKRLNLIGSKLKTLLWIIVGLGILMAMCCALGDMGPGLVIAVTFVILYSLVKSKVNLSDTDEKTRWRRIFSCDFAMLIYGVLSFAAFLVGGYYLGHMLLFGLLWFVFWVALGYFGFRKRLFESALLLNAVVFVFVFGGQILGAIPVLRESSLVERFNDRTEMCAHTWGELDIEHHGEAADPVSNTQVVNGLWALATGGMAGQGMGEGKPSVIPAYHTDMILSSIGEQMGWIGLLFVVVALVLLLRRMAVVGYKAGHPFAFYLCMGFSIITAVQFFIIALGSSGMIPLTGVTVPFLSYGRVSMILNLAAFGIVLSLSSRTRPETSEAMSSAAKSVEQYSYPVAIVTLTLLFFAVSMLSVWQYYQVWDRDKTLIRPAFVLNKQGAPVVEYNPRIALLTAEMPSGRILDRNGVLLATGDKTEIKPEKYKDMGIDPQTLDTMLRCNLKRYYPLGEQLFFMVGDRNRQLYSFNENSPVGYLAEDQHLSYLRGFDNVLYDAAGQPVEVKLGSSRYKASSFLEADSLKETVTLRDYSYLLPFLKDGLDGKELEKRNDDVKNGKYDLHLTVDARLQVALQRKMADYIANEKSSKGKAYKDNNLIRVSAVVLDAQNGDLLASANYPLPDYHRLDKELGSTNNYYNDNRRDKDWKVYTDRDLGTTYQTAPGSTAKVMSAMAGFRKLGVSAKDTTYYVSHDNIIERNPDEPTSEVSMEEAIVKSSNCYFINLVNKNDLYDDLETVYKTVGINIGNIIPYYYQAKQDKTWENGFHEIITKNKANALRLYDNKIRNNKNRDKVKMNYGEWKWAWGHGYSVKETKESFEIKASPLNMARVASSVVNHGNMPVTQYIKSVNPREKELRKEGAVKLLNEGEVAVLKKYMIAETENHRKNRAHVTFAKPEQLVVGGKTGTAERGRYDYINHEEKPVRNDGWYMFFIEDSGGAMSHPLAVAVRIERLRKGEDGSAAAVRLAKQLVDIIVSPDYDYYVTNQ